MLEEISGLFCAAGNLSCHNRKHLFGDPVTARIKNIIVLLKENDSVEEGFTSRIRPLASYINDFNAGSVR